ncbi:MAG: hypothetical protein HYZ35_08255 [Chloroflexi bacterium]|nr:hypothetical protein [Chloroflexota bacterium]
MFSRHHIRHAFSGTVGLLLALALVGCSTAAPTPNATEIAAVAATAQQQGALTAEAQVTADAIRVATGIAQTLTAQPTATFTASATATLTATSSLTPTVTLTPTSSATARPTQPPVTPTFTRAPTVYGSAAGPDKFTTTIQCTASSGGACSPVMPPGDVSFYFTLASTDDAPWALFLPYGLSVERDGANVADMYMMVDAGWLPPGVAVGFGGSKNFQQPGRYVVRSSGCMYVDGMSSCQWTTMAGTTVNFTIQP